MEIQYKKTYSPGIGKRYTMGEITAMLGYAMEVADPRVRMREGRLSPGQVCLLLFAITPEEYALKDEKPKALDALAEKLVKNIPADRLLAWRIMDLKGAIVKSNLQPQTGESIDGGEFVRLLHAKTPAAHPGPVDHELVEARRLQQLCAGKDAPEGAKQDWQAARKALGAALLGLDELYVAYDVCTGNRWPAVGFDGRMEIFTTSERAEKVRRQVAAAHGEQEIWSVRKLTGEEFKKLMTVCCDDGLDLLRVDNGFAAAEINVRDCLDAAAVGNAALRSMMIREVQYGMRWNRLKESGAEAAKVRGALEAMLTLRNFVWREAGNASLHALCAGGSREKCVMLSLREQPEKMLAVFTEAGRAKDFALRMQEKTVPVEMGFDELMQRSAACEGMILDMGFIGYRLQKADYAKVLDLRGKPPVVVRVQAENAPRPAAKPAQDMGSLPNPDDYAPVKKPVQGEQMELPAQPEVEPQNRKGFFKKLFGK